MLDQTNEQADKGCGAEQLRDSTHRGRWRCQQLPQNKTRKKRHRDVRAGGLPIFLAQERPLAGVGPNVGGQVVRPRKVALASRALKRFDASVLTHVPGELVRPREPLVTALVRALEGLLPRVGPQVCLEVGPFDVRLAAPGDRARVAAPLLGCRRSCRLLQTKRCRDATWAWVGLDWIGATQGTAKQQRCEFAV
jgi:hypothetical protein